MSPAGGVAPDTAFRAAQVNANALGRAEMGTILLLRAHRVRVHERFRH
jgi:hypothetical protein